MTADHLDALARMRAASAALSSSRRGMLAGLSSGALASVSLALGGDQALAKKKGKGKGKGKKRCKPCCRADCLGRVCGPDGCGGICGLPCDGVQECCHGVCTYLTGDPGCCRAEGELCSNDGNATFGPKYCCSKSCDVGGTNRCTGRWGERRDHAS